DGTDVIVDCQGLRVRASGCEPPPKGSVAISVRPEKIRLNAPAPHSGDDNVFDARVARATFTGSFLRYELVLPNSQRVIAQVPNVSGRRWSQGDPVQVQWSKDSCVVLHDEESG
ncbi:MAG: TOBE domain-containing protein, partial [Chloroflexota bacterium]|nr:TOBE domain-containing protein [Chloroflexota bacterium]